MPLKITANPSHVNTYTIMRNAWYFPNINNKKGVQRVTLFYKEVLPISLMSGIMGEGWILLFLYLVDCDVMLCLEYMKKIGLTYRPHISHPLGLGAHTEPLIRAVDSVQLPSQSPALNPTQSCQIRGGPGVGRWEPCTTEVSNKEVIFQRECKYNKRTS